MSCSAPLPIRLLLIVSVIACLPSSAIGQMPMPSWRLLSAVSPSYEDRSGGGTAEQIIDFAEHLMREGEFFRAITEYRRLLFFYPNDPRRPMIHFRIGLAFYRGQSYAEAAQIFSEVTRQYPHTFYGQQAWLWQGEVLARQGHHTAAEQLYTDLYKRFPDDTIGQQALYQQGWTLLYRRQWREASTRFRQISPTSPLHASAQQLAEETLKGTSLTWKSPLVAGILSGMLPGSGQLYNGRIGDALLAFFLNGLFIAGIVQATQNNAQVVAGILSFFEAGWYAGNVYGAVSGAYKSNRYHTENFIRNLENQFRLTLPEAQQRSSVGVRFSLGF